MKSSTRLTLVLGAAAALAWSLAAVLPAAAGQAPAAGAPASAPSASATGEVRRVDAAGGRVTIKHGEIPGLELPAMTLVYRADPALLAGIKPGQSVRFTATRQAGGYVITQIQ